VRKKNGKIRMCIDLRQLNSRVAKQKYPFPNIEDCVSRLYNRSVFTLLDLKDSFHQIKVDSNSTKYFSFATAEGQFEYNYLPFGYSEAPAEFQKRILQILNPLIRQEKIIVYMDDILIPTETVEENLLLVEEVLVTLKRYKFEINYSKCQFLKSKVEFLGYVISQNNITLNTKHTEAINAFKVPSNAHEVQRFLRLASYFRKFIRNFALKAKPLQELLKKNSHFNFDQSCIESFNTLKKELTTYPVLALYNPLAETELHTDACSSGLGGVLLQKQPSGLFAVVAYFSKSTNRAEQNYHSFELEMLAIVRSIERFHLYLYGVDFTVVTDCNALVHAVTKANLNPRIARWTLALQNYRFKVTHRPGAKMQHVDALSRSLAYVHELPLERELELRQLVDPVIKQISADLEFNDSDKFKLIDGLVYRKVNDDYKFYVPDQMIPSLLRAHHDNVAHVGTEKTYQGIIKNYWFPAMKRKIFEYVNNCFTCIMLNEAGNRHERETSLYPLPKGPMEVLHVDHFGPLQETSGRRKHVFVVVDAFTRFTWLKAIKSTTTREVY